MSVVPRRRTEKKVRGRRTSAEDEKREEVDTIPGKEDDRLIVGHVEDEELKALVSSSPSVSIEDIAKSMSFDISVKAEELVVSMAVSLGDTFAHQGFNPQTLRTTLFELMEEEEAKVSVSLCLAMMLSWVSLRGTKMSQRKKEKTARKAMALLEKAAEELNSRLSDYGYKFLLETKDRDVNTVTLSRLVSAIPDLMIEVARTQGTGGPGASIPYARIEMPCSLAVIGDDELDLHLSYMHLFLETVYGDQKRKPNFRLMNVIYHNDWVPGREEMPTREITEDLWERRELSREDYRKEMLAYMKSTGLEDEDLGEE